MKFKGWIPDHGEHEEDASEVVETSPDYAAQAVAESYFNHRDGWEFSWPVIFRVKAEDGNESDWEVECDLSPTFSAHKPIPHKEVS